MTTDKHSVSRAERVLAPDLARGAMLLLIALANCAIGFFGTSPGADPDASGLEDVYNLFMFSFVNVASYPVFAFMFGYGLVQFAHRLDASPRVTRSVLVRRNVVLACFGLVHGILLASGDILGAFGIAGIAVALLLLQRGERVVRVIALYWAIAAAYVVVLAVQIAIGIGNGSDSQATAPARTMDSLVAPSYGDAVVDRLSEWPMQTITVLPFIFIVWLGTWAARHQVLDEPARHRRVLLWAAVAGLGVGGLGSLPMGLLSSGYLHVDANTITLIQLLYQLSGQFAGVGYVGLAGLLALVLSNAMADPRANIVVGALTALGQRSLSGYLFQSVVWVVLTAPYALALGERTSSPTFVAAGCAVAVWVISLVGAYLMERRSYRGPAENLLRRLTYRAR